MNVQWSMVKLPETTPLKKPKEHCLSFSQWPPLPTPLTAAVVCLRVTCLERREGWRELLCNSSNPRPHPLLCEEKEKSLHNSLLFVSSNENTDDTPWLKCDVGPTRCPLWHGGFVTLLGWWFLASSQPWNGSTTLNNPTSAPADTESISQMNCPCTDNQINLCLATCSQDALQSYTGHSTDQMKAQKHGRQGQLRPGAPGPPPQAQSVLPATLQL